MLTDTKVRNLKPKKNSYRISDTNGLAIEVRPSGAKLWRYRYRIGDKENLFAVGEYPVMSLAEAREERDKARKLVKQGTHPKEQRDRERVAKELENRNTFRAVAEEWIDQNRDSWSPYYLRQVEMTLSNDVFPVIGGLPIREVSAAQILAILKSVHGRGAETTSLLIRQWCSAIFRFAVANLRADHDPVAALRGSLKRPPVRHRKPLDDKGIPDFLEKLETSGGYQTTRSALRLLMYTFVRPTEMRGAEWSEFDLDGGLWRIPAERMKMDSPHVVPLSRQAIAELRELHVLTGSGRYLFPNYRRPKTHMNATTMNRALERLGYAGQFSAHGFRATASTMLNEMGYKSDWIERQLAHGPKDKVRASYNFAQYIPERQKMMQAWADHIDALARGADVIPIRRGKNVTP